jgi:hypothetical protein
MTKIKLTNYRQIDFEKVNSLYSIKAKFHPQIGESELTIVPTILGVSGALDNPSFLGVISPQKLLPLFPECHISEKKGPYLFLPGEVPFIGAAKIILKLYQLGFERVCLALSVPTKGGSEFVEANFKITELMRRK